MDFRMHSVERAVFSLRELYERYGYKKYKMSKFEEYDLYQENKSFLPSQQIITFTDLNGKLLALKPDVTLSIAKNADIAPGEPEKVYYNENVYRAPRGGSEYREIAQVGLEYLGEIDLYSQCEVLMLAYRSLQCLSGSFVITVSHMGFVSGLLRSCNLSFGLKEKILALVEHKNAHEIIRLCDASGIPQEKRDALAALTRLCGPIEETLEKAQAYVCNETMAESIKGLRSILLALSPELDLLAFRLDFSVINDLSYYNGLIFQGFISDVPRAVLSGGRYDNLMEKLGKKINAIGFAVYVSELERRDEGELFDNDILLLYDDRVSTKKLMETMDRLTADGYTVRAQRAESKKLRFRQLMRISEGGLEIIE